MTYLYGAIAKFYNFNSKRNLVLIQQLGFTIEEFHLKPAFPP